MCISCGNCSTYCEMGIDVRQYAMANQDDRLGTRAAKKRGADTAMAELVELRRSCSTCR